MGNRAALRTADRDSETLFESQCLSPLNLSLYVSWFCPFTVSAHGKTVVTDSPILLPRGREEASLPNLQLEKCLEMTTRHTLGYTAIL